MQGVDGLISGLPTGDIIDSIIEVERGRARQLESQKTELETKLEHVRTYNLRLLSAQLDLGQLARGNTYDGRTVASSASDIATGTATAAAQPGSVTFTVDSLAAAHEIASDGQISEVNDLGAGDISLQVGNGEQVTVSVDASNSSLEDIAAAINDADAGVSASIINDGSASPYRLVLAGETTGADNTISVSATGAADLVDLFDQGGGAFTELTAASDAQISLGTSGALTVTSDTNTIDEVMPGVSIDLHQADGPVTLTVGNDTGSVKDRITTFVESMNSAIGFLNEHASYDSVAGEAGALFSETDLRLGMNRLLRELTRAVPGIDGANTLSAIGITLDRTDGTLQLNEAELDAALADDLDNVRQIFADSGDSSDLGVRFQSLSDATDVSDPFSVDITQPASQAVAATFQDLQTDGGGEVVIAAGSNDELTLAINGRDPETVTLAAGSYAKDELVAHLQSLFDERFTGAQALRVSVDGDRLDLRSEGYGDDRSIEVVAGSADATLGLSTGTSTGVDVAGSIDGAAATGTGQLLEGAAGTAGEGLRLVVTSDTALSGVTVDARRGVASQSRNLLDAFTDAVDGTVVVKENSFETEIGDIETAISKIDERLAQRRESLNAQFLRMEQVMAEMQTQQAFLQSQLGAISGINSNNSNNGN